MATVSLLNSSSQLSGKTVVTEEGDWTITGNWTFDNDTDAPFTVTSGSAVVTNLDADKLAGQEGSYYRDPSNLSAAVAVNKGGTGATSLTDGGVLLGSGTSAVTALAVLSDGQMIVGDGTTDPVAESGATLRTSIGVGTGDSPQFTAVNVGAASDTTLARASAGNLTVEGNALYRAGGTDVAVADGGTGASTLTDGGILLGSGTAAITAMSVLADSEMIVGNGSTDPVAESGATLRTSIGVGTGDSPQFTAVNVGAASDTTLARASAGNLTVEGNALYRAGGGDVAIGDGGTGASTAAAAFAAFSPLPTRGDILYSSSGTVTGARLGVGNANEVLTSDGTDVAWAAASGGGLKGCRVYNNADQVAGTGAVVELTWNSETFDTNSFHDTSSNTGRITIPSGEGGKYVFWTNLMPQARSAGQVAVIMRVNGADAAWSKWDNPNDGWSICFWDVMDLSAADYVQVFIVQDSGSDVTFYYHATTNAGQNSPTNFGCIKIF